VGDGLGVGLVVGLGVGDGVGVGLGEGVGVSEGLGVGVGSNVGVGVASNVGVGEGSGVGVAIVQVWPYAFSPLNIGGKPVEPDTNALRSEILMCSPKIDPGPRSQRSAYPASLRLVFRWRTGATKLARSLMLSVLAGPSEEYRSAGHAVGPQF
jgi:hypothetical protein